MQYAYRDTPRSAIGWLVTATDRQSVTAGLALLGERLGLPAGDGEAAAHVALAALGARDGWLVIYDDARRPADLAGLLPTRGAGRVLITSRNPNWEGYATPVAVEPFSTGDAAEYLIADARRDGPDEDRASAEAIARQV